MHHLYFDIKGVVESLCHALAKGCRRVRTGIGGQTVLSENAFWEHLAPS